MYYLPDSKFCFFRFFRCWKENAVSCEAPGGYSGSARRLFRKSQALISEELVSYFGRARRLFRKRWGLCQLTDGSPNRALIAGMAQHKAGVSIVRWKVNALIRGSLPHALTQFVDSRRCWMILGRQFFFLCKRFVCPYFGFYPLFILSFGKKRAR